MASPANLTSIGEDIGERFDVVSRHVSYLRDAYLLWSCPQRQEAVWLPRRGAQDKLYAIAPLVARLPYLRNSNRTDIDPTVLTEMQVGAAIRRAAIRDEPSPLDDDFLFHVRTAARKEIDFVSELLSGTAIEGKYCETNRWRSEAAMIKASNWDGILCTRNVLDVAERGAAWAVPEGVLAYLIDT